MKNKAFQYQTVTYQHLRPCIDFGDLNAPQGNAFIVHGRAAKTLEVHGFTSEAREINFLSFLWKPNYDTVFDKMAFFLKLEEKPEEINLHDMAMQALEKGGDDIVFKISRKDYDERQESIFNWEESAATVNYWNKKTVEKYLKETDIVLEEVAHTNSLGKNMLSYIYTLKDFKNIERKLLDDGASVLDIENLLKHKDLSGSCAINSMLWNVERESLIDFKSAIELQLYLKNTYSGAFDYVSEDVFGRNYITQFFPVAEKLRNEFKTLQKNEQDDKLLDVLSYFDYWLQTFRLETGFSAGYSHNEAALRNTNLLWQADGIKEIVGERMGKFEKVKINLEKNILETTISTTLVNKHGSKLKV